MKFNISASSLNVLKESPLLFYYNYVMDVRPPNDGDLYDCYGKAGGVMHETIEAYIKDPKVDPWVQFNILWEQSGVKDLLGINGQPLNPIQYFDAAVYGISLLENYKDIEPERKYEFSLINNDTHQINAKGFVDIVCKNYDGDTIILDWKSNSKVDKSHRAQALIYTMFHYLETGVLVKEVIFEYVKIKKRSVYRFTIEELMEYKAFIVKTTKDIIAKGMDINNYELGDIKGFFNGHKKKCLAEQDRRNNSQIINMKISKGMLYFEGLSNRLKQILDMKYSYFVDGHIFSVLFKKRLWDGKKHIFNKKINCMPIGLYHSFKQLIAHYNTNFNTNYIINEIDTRTKIVCMNTIFVDNGIKLRYYQNDAVKVAIDKKIILLNLATSAGKTFISAEIFKRLNVKSLFIVNRIELATQTKKELEDYLGINVGLMTSGQIETDEQITVASIQTIAAILKRKDQSSVDLKQYLSTINCCIWDESQTVRSAGMYNLLSSCLINNHYYIGLSGSPWRNYKPESLEMNAVVGFVGYTKSVQELEAEGYITPTKCYFISYDDKKVMPKMKYADAYTNCIVKNDTRNGIIKDLCYKFKDKKIIVMCKRIEHVEILHEMISDSVMITGSTGKKKRAEDFKNFKESKNGGVLIGMLKIFSAGIDIKNLDVLINASAHKSSIDSVQSIGRVKRKSDGKEYGLYIDFCDSYKFMDKAYKERKKILNEYGNNIYDKVSIDTIDKLI